jgi:hypothetical protein
MKRLRIPSISPRNKKIAGTISAAALMLGVSSAATVGLHFQDNYCGSPTYTGYEVQLTAFGVAPGGWENLTPMNTGYDGCSGPLGYTFNEVIDSTTSTNGLNPIPNGSLDVTWFGPTANFTPFAGYGFPPPNYYEPGGIAGSTSVSNNPATGEEQVYAAFLRDGVNFGPPGGADNDQPGYYVDITGLKSLFTNTPFVIELIASSDSMQLLTNAFVIDEVALTTNSVTYPSTPPVVNAGSAPWLRGAGGGLSTVTPPMSTDHIYIKSNHPQHGTAGGPNGFDNAGTISGFIITDKPVVTSPPQSLFAEPGDSVLLNPYAIGVPPLSYQWRLGGIPIRGATNSSYTIAYITNSTIGNYDVVVTNLYGAATSKVAAISSETVSYSTTNGIVFDSNPDNPQHNGVNIGATWMASDSDGSITRTGVMQFNATNANGISVAASTNLDSPTGTITLWMLSAGTDQNQGGGEGGSLFCETNGVAGSAFILLQQDSGVLLFQSFNGGSFESTANVSDSKWHFVALTYDQSAQGVNSLYVDGVLNATNSNGGSAWAWPTPSAQVQIGFTGDLASFRNYNGLLNDLRFYNTALTAAQITSVYNSAALADAAALQMRLAFAAPPGPGTALTWPGTNGVLQSASEVKGPYLDVSGAVSPYIIVPSATQQYFRYSYPTPTTTNLVSNPYLM